MNKGMGYAAALMLAVLALCGSSEAQNYPARTITLVVPFPPGGGNDSLARLAASKLGEALGQIVVVENKPGANGVIAMRQAGRAAPGGYTLIFANTSSTSINPALHADAGYDPHKDFAPIGLLASAGIGIIAHPSFAPKTVAELIAYAKSNPGKLNVGTSPPGSGSYLSAELFKARTGVNVTYVPYKGAAALMNDLSGGHIPAVFSVVPPFLGQVHAGKLRVLAMTNTRRIAVLPNVPIVSETLPGFEAELRYGLLAPAGTPRPIIERLNAALRTLETSPQVRDIIAKEGGSPLSSTPEEYAATIRREDELWGPLIRGLNLKAK